MIHISFLFSPPLFLFHPFVSELPIAAVGSSFLHGAKCTAFRANMQQEAFAAGK